MNLRIAGFALLSFRRSSAGMLAFSLAFILGLALIASQGLAAAIAARSTLDRTVGMVSYDFDGGVIASTPQATESGLESVPGVRSATFVLPIGSMVEARTATAAWRPVFVQAVPSDFSAEAANVGWNGDFNLTPGHATLSSGLAAALGVQVGSVISLGRELCNPVNGSCDFRNVSYTVSSLVIRTKNDGTTLTSLFVAFIDLADAPTFYETVNGEPFPDPSSYLFLVWVDSSSVLTPLDPQGNLVQLSKIQRELEIQSGGATFESPLRDSLESYGTLLFPLQALFLALSVPALVLALAVSLEALSRTTLHALRNIRLFMVRGMGDTAAVLAAVGPGLLVALAALVLGVWGLPLLFSTLLALLGLPHDSLDLGTASLVAGVVYLLILITLLWRRVRSNLSVEGTKWARDVGPPARFASLTIDYALVVSGVLLWAYVGFFVVIQSSVPPLETLAGSVLRTLTPVATILVALGAVRPLLWSRRVRSGLATLFRKISGLLGKEYLQGRLRRASPRAGVPLVIALAMSLTLLGFVSLQSENGYNEKRIAAALGGDMQVEALGNSSVASGLDSFGGIVHLSQAEISSPFISANYRIIAFNASSYHSVVGNDPYFFASVGGDVRELLRDKYTLIINEPAAETLGLAVGDRVAVSFKNRTAALSVAGIVNAMPGLLPSGLSSLGDPLLYGDLSTLYNVVFPGATQTALSVWRVLLKLAPGTSASALSDALFAAFPSRIIDTRFGGESGSDGSSVVDVAAGFLNVETYLSSVLVLMALSMLASTLLSEREVEATAIRVRGARRATVASFFWGDLASTATLGAVIGLLVGLGGSWFLVQALSEFIDPSPLVRPWVVSADAIAASVALALAALGVLFLLAWHAAEPDSARILKERSL